MKNDEIHMFLVNTMNQIAEIKKKVKSTFAFRSVLFKIKFCIITLVTFVLSFSNVFEFYWHVLIIFGFSLYMIWFMYWEHIEPVRKKKFEKKCGVANVEKEIIKFLSDKANHITLFEYLDELEQKSYNIKSSNLTKAIKNSVIFKNYAKAIEHIEELFKIDKEDNKSIIVNKSIEIYEKNMQGFIKIPTK